MKASAKKAKGKKPAQADSKPEAQAQGHPPYQVMPPQTTAEYEAMKADIKVRGGPVYPVIVDGRGNVIDGHHRLRACNELKIKCPMKKLGELKPAEARALARSLNVLGRRLTNEQLREVIAEQLRDAPRASDRKIAEMLDVSHVTVGKVRREMRDAGTVVTHDQSAEAADVTTAVPQMEATAAAAESDPETRIGRDNVTRRVPKLRGAKASHPKVLSGKALQIWLDAEHNERLKAIAQYQGMAVDAVVTLALAKWIDAEYERLKAEDAPPAMDETQSASEPGGEGDPDTQGPVEETAENAEGGG